MSVAPDFATAVIAQMGGWKEFVEGAAAISEHGADIGFHGFILNSETVKFARDNLSSIMSYAVDQAEDIGECLFVMFQNFRCMHLLTENEIAQGIFVKDSEDEAIVLNCLAWYALEETARSYMVWKEER